MSPMLQTIGPEVMTAPRFSSALLSDLRDWAFDTVGLSPTTESDIALSLVLKRLKESDFNPPMSWHPAIDILSTAKMGQGDPIPAEYCQDRALRLADEVSRFLDQFFLIPAVERREKFDILNALCAPYSSLSRQLEHVRPAVDLHVEWATLESPEIVRFGQLVCEQFTDPYHRTHQLRVRLEQARMDVRRLQKPARLFRQKYPDLAALTKEFVSEFADHSRHQRRKWRAQAWAKLLGKKSSRRQPDQNKKVSFVESVIAYAFIIGFVSFMVVNQRTSTNSSRFYYEPKIVPPPVTTSDLRFQQSLDQLLGIVRKKESRTTTPDTSVERDLRKSILPQTLPIHDLIQGLSIRLSEFDRPPPPELPVDMSDTMTIDHDSSE